MRNAYVDMWEAAKYVEPPYDTRAKEVGFEFNGLFISTCNETYKLLNVTKTPDHIPPWIYIRDEEI